MLDCWIVVLDLVAFNNYDYILESKILSRELYSKQ